MPFSVILTEKGGATQRLDFESEEITVGRVDENDICLPKGNISKKHTKIVVKDGKIIVLDLKSTNGTYVNGKKVAGPQVIAPTDKVYIGDFILNVEPPEMETSAEEAPLIEETPTMEPSYRNRIDSEEPAALQPEYAIRAPPPAAGGHAARAKGARSRCGHQAVAAPGARQEAPRQRLGG